MTENQKYHPEAYWSEVGARIQSRDDGKNVIAGDDEPYYRYKRERFLDLLRSVDFQGKRVLNWAAGPAELLEVYRKRPKSLTGADISNQMVALAKNKVPSDVEVVKIDGTTLPFADRHFDIAFTATVLQHNTDEAMLKRIVSEVCRVSGHKVYLFERIEDSIAGDDLCLGRPVGYYEKMMNENGFRLTGTSFINIRASYYVCGAIRKSLNPRTRNEGEPLNLVVGAAERDAGRQQGTGQGLSFP